MIDTSPLRRSARGLARVLGAVQIAVAIGGAALLAAAIASRALTAWLSEAAGYDASGAASWQGLALAALAAGQLGLWFAALGAMRTVFRALDRLDPAGASRAAGRAARWLWALVGYGILAHAAGSVLASWHYPPGERVLSLSIGSAQVTTALAALLAAFLARAFVLGAALWDDHRAVI